MSTTTTGTKTLRIALYPGDGIGAEVLAQAMAVVEEVQRRMPARFTLQTTELDWGCRYFERHQRVAPDNLLEILAGYDAIFLGAVGMPSKMPDHISLKPLIQIRQGFDQYACVRPARLFPGVKSPLAAKLPIDMVVVRENVEGEYFDCGGTFKSGGPDAVAIQTAVHSRRGIERILRFGFQLAMTRPRRKLTMITKSNAMRHSMVLWDQLLEEVQSEFPQVQTDKMHIDAAAMAFVRKPEHFDVVVGSNLFGDILSDLSGAITGSLGLNPSANLNPERQFPSLFEPVHGSAPDIAGKGIANPVAAILSAGMMLDWLGVPQAQQQIEAAVCAALAEGAATADLGGQLNCVQMGQAVRQRL